MRKALVKDNIKMHLKDKGRVWPFSPGSGQYPAAGSCEHGNEP